MKHPRIYIALPILNEFENLPSLIECLKNQSLEEFELVVCVNQYDSWWENKDKYAQCLNNQESIQYLNAQNDFEISLIDRSSKGKGWPEKRGGVGWARKTAMDYINHIADRNDFIVSIDADTYYPPDYLQSIINTFHNNAEITGINLPYYHRLTGGETDALILRYEIYMRNYLLNMLRIENPYAFTALGSAMAVTIWAYRKIGGITPVKSGEDFYFLQKLVKTGKLGIWTDTIAYPSPRFSDRVLFGTGPALIKGNNGDWNSYPLYESELFELVNNTYEKFSELFENNIPTPMDEFLMKQFNSHDIWTTLRTNYKDRENFIKACKTKVDGLRILQFLKQKTSTNLISPGKNDQEFKSVLLKLFSDFKLDKNESFESSLIHTRDYLFQKELIQRKKTRTIGI
jgi:glycosyltransferase involved in cell wall biosynthesis